jgi:hypothetical protein
VQRLGHQLLAHTGLTQDQHAGVGPGDLLDGVEDLLHLRALADDVLEPGHDRVPVVGLDLGQQPAVLQTAVDLQLELGQIEGLEHVIVGPGLHGLDRRLDRPVGRHHQHQRALVEHPGALDDLQTAGAGHPVVGDDDVEHLALQGLERLLGVGSGDDAPAPVREGGDDALPQVRLVLHDEDLPHELSPPLPARPSAIGRRSRLPARER